MPEQKSVETQLALQGDAIQRLENQMKELKDLQVEGSRAMTSLLEKNIDLITKFIKESLSEKVSKEHFDGKMEILSGRIADAKEPGEIALSILKWAGGIIGSSLLIAAVAKLYLD